MPKQREKTKKTKTSEGPKYSKGPRYSTGTGWKFGNLTLVLLSLAAFLCVAVVFAVSRAGMGLSGGICGEVIVRRKGEVDMLSHGTPPLQTMGKLGDDATPRGVSSVMLRDDIGPYETNYTIPAGCGPGGTVKILHYK